MKRNNIAQRVNGRYTRSMIVRTAANMFLERGYSKTYPKMVSNALGLSPGNLTYYFPTKEDVLVVLIEMLAKFQWTTVQELINEGETPLTALCFELTAMAVMCEENEVAKDLYLSAYTGVKTLDIIRKNDTERAKQVFAEFCSDWTDTQFAATEALVSGIEYATLRVTSTSPPLEKRIASSMDAILALYNVPKERRQLKIQKALAMDYRAFANKMLNDFRDYVAYTTENDMNEAAQLQEEKQRKRRHHKS